MRYRLRTLLIVLAVGPPVLAVVVALGTTLLQNHRERAFLESLYKVEMEMDGLDIPETFIGYPPSD